MFTGKRKITTWQPPEILLCENTTVTMMTCFEPLRPFVNLTAGLMTLLERAEPPHGQEVVTGSASTV